ncbi:hypothetical protein XBO1_2220052 [Xenorhabdus bovienii str. oregonense]|uniref:Uncharacterized protein n=1 Tax=Xenorhabdus bovienii str. oregonense TaxID=1398202 RepID=A0A077P979_XENBV|nr:hypothetical protein XBO1_2220052 [Xenorhabdus bovienii str. oregonense]
MMHQILGYRAQVYQVLAWNWLVFLLIGETTLTKYGESENMKCINYLINIIKSRVFDRFLAVWR